MVKVKREKKLTAKAALVELLSAYQEVEVVEIPPRLNEKYWRATTHHLTPERYAEMLSLTVTKKKVKESVICNVA